MIRTLLFLFFCPAISAQIFTKVFDQPPAADGGDSRAVNWIDYDNDGDIDLFITNGPSAGADNFFYENTGSGIFVKKTGLTITEDGRPSDGSSWGDFDNDGDADLFVANWYNQNNLLYRNNGNDSFTLITGSPVYTDRGYSETGVWCDYNLDGYLDLYVCNSETPFLNYFYKNNGQGEFIKITEGDIVTDAASSRNADWADYDNDGDPDLFVANENNQKNFLYRNEGNGFTKITEGDIVNDLASTFGSSWGDYDNDGDLDLFTANHSNQNNQLYRNNGDGTFTKITTGIIVNDGGYSIGSDWGDIDNDGDLDLFVANGFGTSALNDFLYLNNGDGTFIKSNDQAVNESGWSYGCSFGDYNNDGWLDLAIARCYQKQNNSLFSNNGGSYNWIKFNLKGTLSNKSAVGTVINLYSVIDGETKVQMRQVSGQSGYCGQNLQVHFGLKEADIIDSVIIRWPSGSVKKLDNMAVNQVMEIEEQGTVGVDDEPTNIPSGSMLEQNYPNPFNPSTNMNFYIARDGKVTIKMYDTLGNELRTLVDEELAMGRHSLTLKAEDLPSGVYFCKMIFEQFNDTKKILLLK